MLVRESCVKKGKIIYLCKYNFTLCSLIDRLEVQGQQIEHVAAFNLFWFGSYPCHKVSVTNGMRNGYVDRKFKVRVYLLGTIDSKSGTWSLDNLEDIPRT